MKASIVSLPSGIRQVLNIDRITIGRDPDCNLVITDARASARHCVIYRKINMYYIEDLSSSNGTFVNGERIEIARKLYNNDTVSLGQKTAAFQFRRDLVSLRDFVGAAKNPRVAIPVAGILFVALGLLLYFGVLRNIGKVDLARGLSQMRATHGIASFPDDPEFVAALADAIERVKQEYNDDPLNAGRIKYQAMIEKTLRDNRLPADYSYIVWVESRFDPDAYNRSSGAAGLWQLLPATARHYGIKVDRITDQRLDPEASTTAASRYLSDLISIFGKESFLLVLAAYNAGDANILYALKQIPDPGLNRNFWYLYRNNLIPEETREYVLRIVALIVLHQAE